MPRQGGLFDQPAPYIARMKSVLQATAKVQETEDNKSEAERRLKERMQG
jgi:hypothetical protein